ncbi:hypothetical protein V3564_00755 [Bartonella sp. B12(2025)]
MNLKYFITALAAFTSISVAHGAGLVTSQKLVQGISSIVSPKAFFESAQVSSSLAETFQIKFSSIDNEQWKPVVKLVPVSSSIRKRRSSGYCQKRTRPQLFLKSPMSF